MLVIRARNVNDAWRQAKLHINIGAVHRHSRVGEVLEYPEPVATRYSNPTERVLFDPKRDANPFFHFMEGLWMLAGRNDVAWISYFNQRMMSYSDDGQTYHAAYGHRWRKHFAHMDQLPKIVGMLRDNHQERRAVLQMWSPLDDLARDGKDLPCNTSVYFKVRDGQLYMTVTNRSNDIVWGCYGANYVHMGMLQEYMASMIGVSVGPYHQVSDSWHAYTEYWEKFGGMDTSSGPTDYYADQNLETLPLVDCPEAFDEELLRWMECPHATHNNRNRVFNHVAQPMYLAWRANKEKRKDSAFLLCNSIWALDWRLACQMWLERRAK